MTKIRNDTGINSHTLLHRPTAVFGVVAVSLGLTGLGSVATPGQAFAAEATATAQGTYTDALNSPDTMEFTTAPTEIAEVDDLTWDSENVGLTESPYQAFELDHPGEFAPVSWTGVVDPSREVALLAWNYESGQWDQVRRQAGSAPETTQLQAHLSEDYANSDGKAHLAVIGADNQMTGDEEWAPDEFDVTNSFADPDDYDFSIAHVTDTQFLSEGAANPDLDEVGQERFAEAYRTQMEWIVDNAESRKISYVAHTGDIIENWLVAGQPEEQAREEFEFASEMQSIIDDAGIPNGILPGNHDNGWGILGNDMYNDYFPAERYEEASANWENASYGGPWQEGDNSAHYDLFEVEGHEFIAVYLPYSHNTAQRNWANEILQSFPDRDALLFTHAYLRASGNADGSKAIGNIGYGDNGHLLRTQVVEKNDNLAMVSAGHYHGTTWNHNYNGDGGPVFEMLADYQNYEVGGERNTGFMRLLQFDMDAGEVKVNTYSPKLGAMGAIGYDPDGRYMASSDEYTAPLSLSTRGTTLMTDQMRIGDVDEAVTEPPEDEPTPEPTETPTDPESEQPQQQLAIDQQADVTVTAGQEIEPIDVAVNDEEANLTFSGLPAGLVGVPDERTISGVPETVGDYEVTVTAVDQHDRETAMTFTITVEEPVEEAPEPLEIEQQDDVSVTAGEQVDPIDLAVSDDTATIEVTGLPAEMEFDAETGQLTGTPAEPGTFEIAVLAVTEDGRQAQMEFTIVVHANDELSVEPAGDVQENPETTSTPDDPNDTPPAGDTGSTSDDDADVVTTAGNKSGDDAGSENGDTGSKTAEPTTASSSDDDLAKTGAGATVLLLGCAMALLSLGGGLFALHRRKPS